MKELIIFGAGDIAELAHYYFTNDTKRKIAAFVVDKEYLKSGSFKGLPVIAFEDVASKYPPEKYSAFVAVSYNKMNSVRTQKYLEMKKLGYEIISYISSRITNFGLSIGENCFILEDNTIQPFVSIGNNVTLWSGNHIGHHSIIDDNTFISSHVVVSGGVKIGKNCFIGVNATLRDHVVIGERCLIGAGCLITKSTEDESVYRGNLPELMPIKSSELKNI